MNGYARLQQTAAWVDIVELRLCLFLYDVCNDWHSRLCRAAISQTFSI